MTEKEHVKIPKDNIFCEFLRPLPVPENGVELGTSWIFSVGLATSNLGSLCHVINISTGSIFGKK